MPAPSTPTWSRPPARWRRIYRALQQRPRPACRRLDPGGGLQPQRQRRAGLAVRSPQAAPRRRRAELTARRRCAASGALADGWCFHSLMTGRFGAPANQALSDWMDEAGCRQSAARRRLAALQPLDAAIPARARCGRGAIAAFFASRTRAEIAHRGPSSRHQCLRRRTSPPTCWPIRTCRRAASGRSRRACACRALRACCAKRDRRADPAHGAAAGNAPGPLAGVRVLDFSWALVGSITTKTLGDLGADVIKVESRTRPCLSRHRRAGRGLARGRLRRQALVRAPEHLEAQPRAGPEAARVARRCWIR